MTTSVTINEIAAALAKAQGEMKNATLNKVNPHFKSRYADLAGIRDTVVPVLAANGIAAVQTLDTLGDGEGGSATYILTRLVHASGQWIESRCPIPQGKNMQEMGSAITYARRYSLSAICGIAADEDDDANAVSPQPVVGAARGTPKPVPDGYQAWLGVFSAVANNGIVELRKAFKETANTKPAFTDYLVNHDNKRYEEIKAVAEKVKVPVSA